jgi:hypothetical protein
MMNWAGHRARAEALRERYLFAAEVLGCYVALLDAWSDLPTVDSSDLVRWTDAEVRPRVVKATEAAGPAVLAEAIQDVPAEEPLRVWLAGGELPPVERYLARACLYPVLVALGENAGAFTEGTRGDRHCPRCGGAPQVSFRSASGDQLVSGARQLSCVRCGHTWSFSGSTCPSCGSTEGGKRTLYAEQRAGPVVGTQTESNDGDEPTFPHLRIDACASCERYLIDVDLGRDIRAVPEVDELAALPLALYAADQGLSKIAPNLMGF